MAPTGTVDLSGYGSAGTRIWWAGTVSPSGLKSLVELTPVTDAIANLTNDLQQNWNMTVEQSNHSSGLSGALSNQSEVDLVITLNGDFNSLQDVLATIDGEWYNAASASVTSGRIYQVQYPNSSVQSTGAAASNVSGSPNNPSKPGGFSLSTTGWIVLLMVAVFLILISGILIAPSQAVRFTKGVAK